MGDCNNNDHHGSIKTSSTRSELETIARLNNMGVVCMTSTELSEAGRCLRRSLDKTNEMTFFSANAFPAVPQSKIVKDIEMERNLYIYQRGDYDEGMNTFSQPVSISSDVTCMHDAIATILFNLGILHLRLNKDDEASDFFTRALESAQRNDNHSAVTTSVKSSKKGKSCVSVIAILHNIGNVQYRSGRYEDAVRTYNKALQIQKNTCKIKNSSHCMLDLAATLNCLGVLHFHLAKADTDKAMKFYEESLSFRCAVLGFDCENKEIATTLNNMGRVHYMIGEHKRALELYAKALNMRRRLLGNDHIDVAATAYNAGQTFHQLGEFEEAMELYEEFLVIAKKHLGSNHRDVAIMLKCMAQIHHERKQF